MGSPLSFVPRSDGLRCWTGRRDIALPHSSLEAGVERRPTLPGASVGRLLAAVPVELLRPDVAAQVFRGELYAGGDVVGTPGGFDQR